MPTYIIGNRETGPSLADFLRGVNDSIGTYADMRHQQIGLDRQAAAAQASAAQAERDYRMEQNKLMEQRRGRHDTMERFDREEGFNLMNMNRVDIPQVGINQQNADTSRMGENRQGALQDRRFDVADQLGGIQPTGGMTLGDVLAAQSGALSGTAFSPPASSAANRGKTLAETEDINLSSAARNYGFGSVQGGSPEANSLRYRMGMGFDTNESTVPGMQSGTRKVDLENATAAQGANMASWQQSMMGVPDTFGAMPQQPRDVMSRAPDGSVQMSQPNVAQSDPAADIAAAWIQDNDPGAMLVMMENPEKFVQYQSAVRRALINGQTPPYMAQYFDDQALAEAQARGGIVPGGAVPTDIPSLPQGEGGLHEAAGKATGVYPALTELWAATVGQIPGVPVAEDILAARQELRTAMGDLRRSLANNPRFPVGEMDRIEEEISILPSAFDSGPAMQTRMRSIENSLKNRIQLYEADANDPTLDKDTREAQRVNVRALRNFLSQLAIPQGGTQPQAGPEVGAVEDGYRFLGGDPANPASWEAAQ